MSQAPCSQKVRGCGAIACPRPAGERRQSCSHGRRRGGSPPISPSCRSSSQRRRVQRGPLTRGRPTERRFAGCPDSRRGSRSLDPVGSRFPGRGEGEEGFLVFRIARRLRPGQALLSVSAVRLRDYAHHADHPSTGRCKAKWGGASEQNCTRSVRCGWCG